MDLRCGPSAHTAARQPRYPTQSNPAILQSRQPDLRGSDAQATSFRCHVPVAEQFLNGANVGAAFQKMRRERMTERVATGALPDSARPHRSRHGTLGHTLMKVMPPNLAGVSQAAVPNVPLDPAAVRVFETTAKLAHARFRAQRMQYFRLGLRSDLGHHLPTSDPQRVYGDGVTPLRVRTLVDRLDLLRKVAPCAHGVATDPRRIVERPENRGPTHTNHNRLHDATRIAGG